MHSSRDPQFQLLMATRDLIINLDSDHQHHDATQLKRSATRDLLNYILDETPQFPLYHAYLLNLALHTEYLITLLHIQDLHQSEHGLIHTHFHSLANIAIYINFVKELTHLPPVGLLQQRNIFARDMTRTPTIEDVSEDRPSPPPGFGPND